MNTLMDVKLSNRRALSKVLSTTDIPMRVVQIYPSMSKVATTLCTFDEGTFGIRDHND